MWDRGTERGNESSGGVQVQGGAVKGDRKGECMELRRHDRVWKQKGED